MKKTACIFSRVSTKDQTTSNQLLKLQEIAKQRDLDVVKEISETVSGGKGREDRKGFDDLIKGAIRKDYDIILVWSVDRLGRSLQDLVGFLNEINAVGCDLYIHQSGIDTSTPSGKMMFQMCGVFAEFERGMIRERVVAGLDRAKKKGVKLGRPTNLNQGMVTSIKFMKEKGIGIKKIARDLKVGVGTVYRVLETA